MKRAWRWLRFPGLPIAALLIAIGVIEWTQPERAAAALRCNSDEAMVVSPDRGYVCVKDWRAAYPKSN